MTDEPKFVTATCSASELMKALNIIEQVKSLTIDALYTDGGHHKQWYLEEIIKLVSPDEPPVDEAWIEEYGEWEPGIEP